ncbi:hypothetical protein CDV31_012960 [Fusarium ambrosium]|uniref:Uncharacterized protein n=1 Tax=Fusarium ambrosium TaxID=131363 RepID=A0A428T6J3_9HYPO|nr:hypothetical protein CDV31_012960 [Fusarium ambrosium]
MRYGTERIQKGERRLAVHGHPEAETQQEVKLLTFHSHRREYASSGSPSTLAPPPIAAPRSPTSAGPVDSAVGPGYVTAGSDGPGEFSTERDTCGIDVGQVGVGVRVLRPL